MRLELVLVTILGTLATSLREGELCFHRGLQSTGVCTYLPLCPTARWELEKGDRPQNCDFRYGSQISTVCCVPPIETLLTCAPKSGPRCFCKVFYVEYLKKISVDVKTETLPDTTRNTSLAKRMCNKNVHHVCPLRKLVTGRLEVEDRCGMELQPPRKEDYYTGVVSGGIAAFTAKQYPHMALLGYERVDGTIQYSCGGSLISEDFVLTAAHCRQVNWVLLGSLNRTAESTENSAPQLVRVKEVIPHPAYTAGSFYNDIALLRLEHPVKTDEFVRPACLHTGRKEDGDEDVGTGIDLIAAGWGNTEDSAPAPSDTLMAVELRTKPMDLCAKVLDSTKLPKGLTDQHLCAGGDSNKDTCPGDSGGPLMMKREDETYCMYSIVGVVSFGPLCAVGNPAVYTKVASFITWIESIVWAVPRNQD